MPFVEQIMKKNFIEYASYVIKERSIPHIDDGCKPVQRRILHTLIEADDGKFHKVANITGSCTKYHPHGDAPIYESLINIANKNMFIDKQGNFGNPLTGDPASAARYIECRISSLGKKILYSPEITEYIDSYDGRNKEPVTFPAKIPMVLITGAEGIAVVMATTIVAHNFNEVIQALINSLQGKPFTLYPDFLSGGYLDVSEYNNGLGKIRLRANLDTSNNKQIVIKEIPFNVTTERLIHSVEQAARSGKIQISEINDYTAENIEIVISLPRGVYAADIVDSLYAFTDCETSVSLNPIVIANNKPKKMETQAIIEYFTKRLPLLLTQELKIDEKKIKDKIHARTLERIFIEEGIYKRIETSKTSAAMYATVKEGLDVFKKEIKREVTKDDIEILLKIPIRRISAYDIEKHQKELIELKAGLKTIQHNIKHILPFTLKYLEDLLAEYGSLFPRRTKITTFETVKEKDVAQRNLVFSYNAKTGYAGYGVSNGRKVAQVSSFDKIILFKKLGSWIVINATEKTVYRKKYIIYRLSRKRTVRTKNIYRNICE